MKLSPEDMYVLKSIFHLSSTSWEPGPEYLGKAGLFKKDALFYFGLTRVAQEEIQ